MAATIFLLLGAFITWLNLYTSFFRGLLHNWLHPGEPDRFVSGFPLIGTLFLGIAWLLFPAGSYLGYTALALMVLDTGGPHWFIYALLRQRSKPAREKAPGSYNMRVPPEDPPAGIARKRGIHEQE